MKPGAGFVAVVSCVLLVAACTTPATTRTESPPEAGPRFARGGPDAEEYGASLGHPKGSRLMRVFPLEPVWLALKRYHVFDGASGRRARTVVRRG
jgi:hypothetical protein